MLARNLIADQTFAIVLRTPRTTLATRPSTSADRLARYAKTRFEQTNG